MSDRTPSNRTRQFGPWTTAGGPDPDFDDVARTVHHLLLTDPGLLTHFRRRFPEQRLADYDQMVRLLDWVWDCPHDGTANVTGFRCAVCRRTRASAEGRLTARRVCADATRRVRRFWRWPLPGPTHPPRRR